MAKKKKPIFGPDVSGPDLETEGTEEKTMQAESDPGVLIVPPPEKKAAPIVTKPKRAIENPSRSGVSVDIFIRVSGQKPHRMAGFRRWAMDQGFKRMPVKDWRREYEKFLCLPV
jgi:hypothetical protein